VDEVRPVDEEPARARQGVHSTPDHLGRVWRT
jgi:hypothetical protein